MSLRRPTLDEWFNAYQHRKMWQEHSFITGGMSVDVTDVVADWGARDEKPNFPAILARAAALAAREHPRVNRAYLRTLRGDRIVEFEGIHINMPVRFDTPDGPVLTAVCLRDADHRTAAELRDEIRDHVNKGLDGTQITRIVASKPNTLFWRLALRGLWFAAWRLPLVERHAGAIGVSSTASGNRSWRHATFTGATPTSMLIAISAVRREEGRTLLDIGFTGDHLIVDGVTIREFGQTLGDLLEGVHPLGVEALR
ncbi:MAG: hypothetical protein EP330_06700 [Deltaproteobacteria bacterium]|nr:MAG: hypothetical protein EP330_06700 [Deltaproteobacteria bacterium]